MDLDIVIEHDKDKDVFLWSELLSSMVRTRRAKISKGSPLHVGDGESAGKFSKS